MRELTLEDFKVNRENCKYHASGSWSVPIFSNECEWYINYSDILTRLIFLAGRFCESYASDLFIHWTSIVQKLNDRNYTGEKLVLGFRESGVDSNDWVVKHYNETSYYYRAIAVIEIVVNGNKIDMYMEER